MKNNTILNFLGIGSAFNPNLNNTSAFFELNSELFLIDCGEGIFFALLKHKLLERYKTVNVLITHTHSDHIATLGHLLLYCFYELNKKVKIFFPDEHFIFSLLNAMGIEKNIFMLIELKNIHYFGENMRITAVKQEHVSTIPCFGYLIEIEGHSFFYSGDARTINNSILEKFLNNEIDILYQDTCSENFNKSLPHLSLSELSALIPPEKRDKVFCMHLDSKFNTRLALELGFRIPKQIS